MILKYICALISLCTFCTVLDTHIETKEEETEPSEQQFEEELSEEFYQDDTDINI